MSVSLCVKCNRFHAFSSFENHCSQCYLKVKPIKFLKLYDELKMGPSKKNNYYYSDKYLMNYTIEKSLKNNSKFNILCFCVSNVNYLDFLDAAFNIFKVEKVEGITAEQAKELLNKYRNSKIYEKTQDMGYQNLICGLVVDWWNINLQDHGAEATCNWSNARMKPHVRHQIRPAAYRVKKNQIYPYLPFSYRQSLKILN